MKKLIFVLLLAFTLGVHAQYIKRVNETTFVTVKDIPAGDLVMADGSKVPIYQTVKGKLYYYKINLKSGKMTRRYIKPVNL